MTKGHFAYRAGSFLSHSNGGRVVGSLAAFVRLSRLKFLAGGIVGGGLGTAIGVFERGAIDWGAYALAQTAITSLHLMTHYANDYFDLRTDARSIRTPFSGGSGALVDGSLPPRIGLLAALICLALGLAAIAGLLATGRAVAAGLAVAIGALAWAYSAPPIRLLTRGLGELDTALVVAVLVPLCAYAAQAGAPSLRALASTMPGAAAMLAMMLCVEIPDAAVDGATGKRTLVVRLGERRVRALVFWALGAGLPAVGVALAAGAPPSFALVQVLALGPAAGLARALAARATSAAPADAEVAGRGVALFFLVSYNALLGYLV